MAKYLPIKKFSYKNLEKKKTQTSSVLIFLLTACATNNKSLVEFRFIEELCAEVTVSKIGHPNDEIQNNVDRKHFISTNSSTFKIIAKNIRFYLLQCSDIEFKSY